MENWRHVLSECSDIGEPKDVIQSVFGTIPDPSMQKLIPQKLKYVIPELPRWLGLQLVEIKLAHYINLSYI